MEHRVALVWNIHDNIGRVTIRVMVYCAIYKMANEEQFDLERKINTLIGVDRKSIPNILKSLRSEKKFLEGRVSSASK